MTVLNIKCLYFYSLIIEAPNFPPPLLNMDLMEDLKDVIFDKFSRNNTTNSLLVCFIKLIVIR